MKVYKLTTEQAEALRGQQMPNKSYYNVDVKDKHGNIIISREQHDYAGVGVEIDYEPLEEDNGVST